MLQKIDSSLIRIAQWTVRQIELYTPLTKKDIESFSISLYFWTTVIYAALLAASITVSLSLGVPLGILKIVLALTLPGLFYAWNDYKKISNRSKTTHGMLPEMIISRKKDRTFLLMVYPVTFMILGTVFAIVFAIAYTTGGTGFVSLLLGNSALSDNMIIDAALYFANMVFVAIVIIEYLFCTASLPPEEKEKRQLEKETRNMIPIEIKN